MNKNQFLKIFTCLCLSSIEAKRDYIINHTEIFCFNNMSEVESSDCHVELSGIKGVLYGHVVLKKPVTKLRVQATVDNYMSNGRKLRLVDYEEDVCGFFETLHKNKLVNLIGKRLLSHSNVLPKCPFKANFNYTLHNFTYNEDEFPAFMPISKFRTKIRLYSNKDSSEAGFMLSLGEIVSLKKKVKNKRNG